MEFSYICFFVGAFFMAIMDIIHFQRPMNSGYWSIHTYGSRSDAWHHSKRLALLCFALGIIGEDYTLITVYYVINHPLVWMAVLAFIAQWAYHIGKRFVKHEDNR